MHSYEDLIIEVQESMGEECKNCPHKDRCKNQCVEETVIYNPNLNRTCIL